jgi:ATP-dependent RNA helicase SUPV3L1/SUV3
VSINHLPGILLASMAECESWIAVGLIPIAERRTVRTQTRTTHEPVFDPEVLARLAAEVPAWRTRGAVVSGASRMIRNPDVSSTGLSVTPDKETEHRRRQSILSQVRRKTGLYIAQDLRTRPSQLRPEERRAEMFTTFAHGWSGQDGLLRPFTEPSVLK